MIVFTSAPSVLPEQNDRYWIQPWKVNEIKAYKKMKDSSILWIDLSFEFWVRREICLCIILWSYGGKACKCQKANFSGEQK